MLTEHEMKPLTPLTHGTVLLVGVKASNLSDEIRSHPRVIVWDSQHEHWTSKDVPSNTRAIFMTKFMGHAAFKNIVAQAKKRHITVFNPQGTGIITRQVKELLALFPIPAPMAEMKLSDFYKPPVLQEETKPMTQTEQVKPTMGKGKLLPLMQFINPSLKPIENARILLHKAGELGIDTTLASLAQMVAKQARDAGIRTRASYPRVKKTHTQTDTQTPIIKTASTKEVDVSVQILDEMIRSLTDMRTFLVATVEENASLREKLATLKKVFGE